MPNGHKILIIEDDFDISEMLQTFFSTLGYAVTASHWGEDGVNSAQEQKPDLIILDIRLPDIDGYEVARRIKGDRATAEIPIIYLTERRDRADRLRGLELGADDYITKPFDMAELKFRVKNIISRYQPQVQTNPITGLPEGSKVTESILAVATEPKDVLVFAISGMEAFSKAYGQPAADDAIRKTAIIVRNTLRDAGIGEYYLGHLSPHSFGLLFISPDALTFSQRFGSKLEMAMEFFQPAGVDLARLTFVWQFVPKEQVVSADLIALTMHYAAY